jgi:hypothetical protein
MPNGTLPLDGQRRERLAQRLDGVLARDTERAMSQENVSSRGGGIGSRPATTTTVLEAK